MPDALRLPPLNALKAFEAAARHLSLTRAAEELHVTHGAVSRHVAHLEEFLGCRLFERRPQGLELTARGRELAFETRLAFERLAAAAVAMRTLPNENVVTVSTLPSVAARWLVPRLYKFQERHPDMEIRVSTSAQTVNFNQDGIDFAIRWGRGPSWPGTHSEKLFALTEFPVCSPKLLQGEHALRTPNDLAHAVLLHDRDYAHWERWLRLAGADKVNARKGIVSEDMNVLLQTAIEGGGVVLASEPLSAAAIHAGWLVKPFIIEMPLEQSYYLVYPDKRPPGPALQAALEWLREEAHTFSAARETRASA